MGTLYAGRFLALTIASFAINVAGDSSSASSGTGCSSSGSHGSSHGAWWRDEYEYYHFEAYVIVCLVFLAMVFDTLFHKVRCVAMASHIHESKQEHTVHRHQHVPLWETLVDNCSGELMVLGFLAFLVWCVRKAKFFDAVANGLDDYDAIALPSDGASYLHMVEDVHMQLFVAMIFYITLVALTVFFTMRAEDEWEAAEENLLSLPEQTGRRSIESAINHLTNFDLTKAGKSFFWWRKRFLRSLDERRASWDPLDRILHRLIETEMTAEASTGEMVVVDCSIEAERTAVASTGETLSQPVASKLLDAWFPFHMYLELECRFLILNLVQISETTWVVISLLQLVKAQLLRETRSISMDGFPLVVACSCLGCLSFVMLWRFGNPHKSNDSRSYCNPCGAQPWLRMVRLLQIILFTMCLSMSRNLASEHAWQHDPGGNFLRCVFGIIGLFIVGVVLGMLFPVFSIWIARADFMQEFHLDWFSIIIDDHMTGRDEFDLHTLSHVAVSSPSSANSGSSPRRSLASPNAKKSAIRLAWQESSCSESMEAEAKINVRDRRSTSAI